MDLALAVRILDRVDAPARSEHVGVDAVAAAQPVRLGAAVERVVARPADQNVEVGAAFDVVVAGTSEQEVGAFLALDLAVVAGAAEQRVGTVAAVELVGAGVAFEVVVFRPAVDRVVAAATIEMVLHDRPVDRVGRGLAEDDLFPLVFRSDAWPNRDLKLVISEQFRCADDTSCSHCREWDVDVQSIACRDPLQHRLPVLEPFVAERRFPFGHLRRRQGAVGLPLAERRLPVCLQGTVEDGGIASRRTECDRTEIEQREKRAERIARRPAQIGLVGGDDRDLANNRLEFRIRSQRLDVGVEVFA